MSRPYFQGLGHKGAIKKIQETFWEILKTNWKVWTVFQFVNVNYVPQQVKYFQCQDLPWLPGSYNSNTCISIQIASTEAQSGVV